MTWSRNLPGNHTVEITSSSNGSPPDRQGGMSTNMSTQWLRLDGGPWQRLSERSLLKSVKWWETVQTEADIYDALAITVDPPDTAP